MITGPFSIQHKHVSDCTLKQLTWRSNQDFRVPGRKRHPAHSLITELLISLFPSYFFDLKIFFFYLIFFPFHGGTQIWTEGSHGLSQQTLGVNTQCKTSQRVLHTQWSEALNVRWFTRDQPESVTPTGNQSLDHPVFRDALTNLCKQAC